MKTTALPGSIHPESATAVRLHDWGVMRAVGAEARKFLHGQLTQDVEGLQPGTARLAGYCSAKGRLLASFVMWPGGADEVLLACSADLLPAVLKRLSMFVLRAQCKLSDASAALPLWGIVGTAGAEDAAGDAWSLQRQPGDTPGGIPGDTAGGATLIRLPDAVADGQATARWLQAGGAAPDLPALDDAGWRWLEVMSGVPRIVAVTSEQFVPQMINLELVGGVNFQKGCYPGQEIVARSQYRGTLKRRAYVLQSALQTAADAALAPGQEIFHSADPTQPAGMVVLAGAAGARHAVLAELKIAALAGGSLHAGSAQGPLLQPAALPYPIPAEAA